MPATSTIRYATDEDLPAVTTLLAGRVSERLLAHACHDREVLVLRALDGALLGAALFSIARGRGHVHVLVADVQAQADAHACEERLLGVVEAMCDAYGATTLDVPGRRAA